MAIFKAIHVEGRMLSEMLVGEIIHSTQSALQLAGRNAAIGGLRGGIDGAISGAIGNIVITAADESTWRKGVQNTIGTLGASLLQRAAIGRVAGRVLEAVAGAKSVITENKLANIVVRLNDVGIAATTVCDLKRHMHSQLNSIENLIQASKFQQAKLVISQVFK